MRSLMRAGVGILIGCAIGIGIPRNAGTEANLRALWHVNLADDLDRRARVESGFALFDEDRLPLVIPVSSSNRYGLFDPLSGKSVRSGVRADIFTSSYWGFINQPRSAEVWVVQSWDGQSRHVLTRTGLAILDRSGRLLIDASAELLDVFDLESGAQTEIAVPLVPTVFDAIPLQDAPPMVAVGSATGDLRFGSGPHVWVHDLAENSLGAESAAVYALHSVATRDTRRSTRIGSNLRQLLDSGSRRDDSASGGLRSDATTDARTNNVARAERDFLVVYGQAPQIIGRITLASVGRAHVEQVFVVPRQYEVFAPTTITTVGTTIAVGLNRAVLLIDGESGAIRLVPVQGLTMMLGVLPAKPFGIMLVGRTHGSTILVALDEQGEQMGRWEYDRTNVAAAASFGGDAGAVVVTEAMDGWFSAIGVGR